MRRELRARRALVVFLAASAAVLSFDALRTQALASGAVHHHALAALWAVVIDGMAAAGILGVRGDQRDWRAWAMLVLAFVASVAFQVVTPPAWLARAVPPVALFLAIVVVELSRESRDAAGASREPATEAPAEPDPAPAGAPIPEPTRPDGRPVRALSAAERRRVLRARSRDPKVSARQVAAKTGIPYTPVRVFLREEAARVASNGQREHEQVHP
jgi:hypothetical protein